MSDSRVVITCQGTGCVSADAAAIHDALSEAHLADVEVKRTGCHGFCQRGPIVVVEPEGIFYSEVTERDVPKIVESLLKEGKPVDRLFYRKEKKAQPIPHYPDIPFYEHQHRIVLRNCGQIDPEKIDDYIAKGGYVGLSKALDEMSPEEVVAEVERSGLRGRGGAGFRTGTKWRFCREAEADRKYVICNADEGDPGAFMDRSILESDPHSVLEGLILAGYAIGAGQGYLYVRDEYPLALQRLRTAIEQARERGFLGPDIRGSSFGFEVEIKRGAGAFVCGEETALMESIMGRRGMPRPRPPYPATHGVWGQPSNINNVKTLASVPLIVTQGGSSFAEVGTADTSGTAVFALTGKVVNSGLLEVPMGTTLREIVFDIGGGVPDGKAFKAVQTGGPSGGCIPESLLDVTVDFASLAEVGSIMGSGGMIVMDEDTCMVDVAHYFVEFTQAESCGKCAPCRLGTKLMLEYLAKIKSGQGEEQDIERLERLAWTVKHGSLCGLGQTAPNPILTTLKYFRHEYEAHIRDKRCPAKVCRDLFRYEIDQGKCVGCLICLKECPTDGIVGELKQPHAIDPDKCIRCGVCFSACPKKLHAVVKVDEQPATQGVQ